MIDIDMDLTIALTILGAGVLLALLAHGWWKTRRAGPRRADPALPAAPRRPPRPGVRERSPAHLPRRAR